VSIQTVDPQSPTGLIFDIQAHSVHDGPGTRTTVFMNGCPLSCEWCCNPEGLNRTTVVMHRDQRCMHCGKCAEACPRGAISPGADGQEHFDRSLCKDCSTHECVEFCYHEGNVLSGKTYTMDQLMAILQRDRSYWGSRGGVTFSGGEPLLQRDFILPVLRKCSESRINTCIETTACLDSDYFMEAASYLNWIFIDIKNMDPVAHKARTGVDNALILKNVQLLAGSDLDCFVVIRIPVIPGFNDSEANIRATARFVKACGLEVINLLPFHRLSESKWRQVGRDYAFKDIPGMNKEDLEPHAQWVRDEGLTCYTGWETPF